VTDRNPQQWYLDTLRRQLEVEDAKERMFEAIENPPDPRASGFAHEEGCPCKQCQRCRVGEWHNVHKCTRAFDRCSRRNPPKQEE
jgi:hypothetical protein